MTPRANYDVRGDPGEDATCSTCRYWQRPPEVDRDADGVGRCGNPRSPLSGQDTREEDGCAEHAPLSELE